MGCEGGPRPFWRKRANMAAGPLRILFSFGHPSLVPWGVDCSEGLRSLPEIQKRGGWRTFSSVRRYEKAARLGAQWRKLRPGQRRELAQAVAEPVPLQDMLGTFAQEL